jgi:small subunit ribosomal protein S20
MPIIKSAIKRARQNEVRRARLLPVKTRMKSLMREFTDLAKAGKKADAAKLLPQVYRIIDTAAKKNIIHRNNAARKKSLIARLTK